MPDKRRKIILKGSCEVCGFDRYLESCHIVPKRIGGGELTVNKIILCPNHHKLLDYGLLNIKETALIENKLFKLVERYENDLKVLEYLYFLLGYKENAPKWLDHTRIVLMNKISNADF